MLDVKWLALLFVPMPLAASTPERFTLTAALEAHQSMDEWEASALIATGHGEFVAWSEGNNLFVAHPPEFKPRHVCGEIRFIA